MMDLTIFILSVFVCGCFGGVSLDKCNEYSQGFLLDTIPVNRTGGATSFGKVAARIGEFPHMASLGYEDDNGEIKWQCGGSLISDRYVLTTAVCVTPGSLFLVYVRLGEQKISAEDFGTVEYNISDVIPHPEYKLLTYYHDIALIKLDETVAFSPSIRPACFYESFTLSRGTELSATSWDRAQDGQDANDTLLNVYLDLFTNIECNDEYKTASYRSLPFGILDRLQVCARGRKVSKNTCQEDAGGALQLLNKDKNVYEIVGLTSFGVICGTAGVPAVYTRIAGYVPWIEQVVWK